MNGFPLCSRQRVWKLCVKIDSAQSTTCTRFLLYAAMYRIRSVLRSTRVSGARGLAPSARARTPAPARPWRLLTAPLAVPSRRDRRRSRVRLVVCTELAARCPATPAHDLDLLGMSLCTRVAGADYHLGGRLVLGSSSPPRAAVPGLRVWRGARHRLGPFIAGTCCPDRR